MADKMNRLTVAGGSSATVLEVVAPPHERVSWECHQYVQRSTFDKLCDTGL